MDFSINELLNHVLSYVISFGPKLLGAIIVLVFGFWFSNILSRLFYKFLQSRDIDASLRTFIKSFTGISLKVLVLISAISMLGVAVTSFIAILGAAGLAVGLALQGSLSNLAGGVMILLFKPFKLGDFIETQGFMGTVKEIQIFHTLIYTPDNKKIVIPNGSLANSNVTNFSSQETRRLEWTFGVAYGTDYDKAEAVIREVLENDERILKDQPIFIGLKEMDDSSVNILTRSWAKISDFWPAYYDINKNIYKAFNDNNIEIPFPQMDVHLKK